MKTSQSSAKRILFVSHEASRTGAPIFLLRLLEWLRKHTQQEFDILLARGGPLEPEFEQLGRTYKVSGQALPACELQRYGLIYSNTCCNGTLLERFNCGQVPILTHLHELDYGVDATGARNIAAVLKQSHHFLACAKAVADRFSYRFRVAPERLSLQYELVSVPQVTAGAKAVPAAELRQRYDLPDEAFIVAGCGTFDLRKAPDLFLQLAARMQRAAGQERPLRFIWLGKRNELEPGRILDQDLRRLGLQRQVKFIGELAVPHPLLALSDAFCLPSREDPFPLAMLEAAALGKPILCFAGSGGGEEFCALGGGIAVPFLDVAALADACLELMRHPERRTKLGARAAETVQEHFDLETAAPQFWQKVEALLHQPPPASEYRRHNSTFEEIVQDWILDEAPNKAYLQSHQTRRAARAEALKQLNAAKREAAVQALMEGVFAVMKTNDPLAVLEALNDLGGAMAPLDAQRSAALLDQAKELERQLRQRLALTEAPMAPGAPLQATPVAAPRKSAADPAEACSALTRRRYECCEHPPLVSIIIPTFNNLELTQQCLASIAQHTSAPAHEVIVVDNASDDGTVEFLRQEEKANRLRLVANAQNLGFARACNQGAQAARGERLLFLNNDTQVTPGWLEALVQAAAEPEVGIVGARLLYADDTIQHAGIEFINGLPDHPHRHAPAAAPEVNQLREFDMVTGACLLIERELFVQLAGFDEAYRNGVEDVDLCLRVRTAGRKVVYEPKAVAYHYEGQSAGRFDHVKRNLAVFFQRWAKAFDSQWRLRVPAQPRRIPASQSLLLQCHPHAAAPVKVAWEGSFLDYGSLSHVNRELTQRLSQAAGLELTCVGRTALADGSAADREMQGWARALCPQSPADVRVTVRHAWPPKWQRPRSGKLVVIQPWEYGALPVEWVQSSRQVDEFWVPTEYVRRVYVESGIAAAKIQVVPNGIDPERFQPAATPLALPTQKRFKFLFVGGTIHRKGPDVLLKAYLQAFSAADEVCLVIKDFGGQSCYAGQTMEQAIAAARRQPGAPEILHLTEELPPESLPGLYTACDCLVHPYRGEGFGLPVLEAMACGLPVVVTAGGAADDFAGEEWAFRIPATRSVLGQSISGMKLTSTGWLLEPDANALAQRMQWLVAHPAEARAKGQAAGEHARQHWTWERAAQKAAARLQALTASTADPQHATRLAPQATRLELPRCALTGHLGLARELLSRHKPSDAWEATLAALKVRPFHPEAYLLLAEIASHIGDGQSARLCAEQARRLAPGWKPARQFLNRRLQGSHRPGWLVLPEAMRKPEAKPAPRLTVCLITKNEEKFIAQCLQSVRALAHQIVVVDTGSTDRTVALAQEHGAEVHPFTWCDDFSAARNAALEHATGDWVLVLDADEELSAEDREKLRAHLGEAAVLGWRLPLVDVGREALGRSYVPRLFRNAPGLFYIGRIHEQVFSSLEVRRAEWGLESRLGEATLLHHGYSAEVMRERKKVERNLALLERAVAELPDEPHLLMNLGLELSRSGRETEALERYRQAFQAMAARPAAQVTPEGRETLLAQYCTRLSAARQFEEIVRVLTSPLARAGGGLNASLHFALGLAHMELGQPREAVEPLERCLALRHRPSLSPVNPDVLSAAPQHCLALCQVRLGNIAAAEQAFQNGLKEQGHQEKLRLDYARFLAEHGRPVEALQMLHALVSENTQKAAAWRLGGQIALSRAEFLEFARDWTHEARTHLPQDDVLAAQRAEVLLLSQDTAGARELWERLWGNDRRPGALAALLLCDLVQGTALHAPQNEAETAAVTRAFIDWYRKCLGAGAKEVVVALNARTAELHQVLPEAARILEAVNSAAGQPTAGEVCVA